MKPVEIDEAIKLYRMNLDTNEAGRTLAKSIEVQERFVRDYPKSQIKSLSLKDYLISKEGGFGLKKSFCRRIRYELDIMGHMGNIYYYFFGVYYNHGTDISLSKSLYNKFGDDYNSAFEYVKDEIVALLDAFESGNYELIEDIDLNKSFKYRLLMVYFPNEIIPVCTVDTLNGYCNVVGIQYRETDEPIYRNLELVEFRKNTEQLREWSNFEVMRLFDWMWKNGLRIKHNIQVDEDVNYTDGKAKKDRINSVLMLAKRLKLVPHVMEYENQITIKNNSGRVICMIRPSRDFYQLMSNKEFYGSEYHSGWRYKYCLRLSSIKETENVIVNDILPLFYKKTAMDVNEVKHDKDDSNRVLFCNIAYMKYYRGITSDDIPYNGGEYVEKTKDAHEKYNFLSENGRVFGFVETKYRNKDDGRLANKLHIERIDSSAKNKEFVEDVTVIFCAKKTTNETVIVGWYEHGTVYRGRIDKVDYKGASWGYNITASAKDAYLIEDGHRDFIIGRTKNRNDAGFGQSNVWYADDEKSQEIKKDVLDYISSIKNDSYVGLKKEAEEIDRIYENERLVETERDVVAKSRIGQGLFRDKLIQRDGCCVMCGIRHRDLLRASHIKPWKDCKDSNEKLSEDNGLLLCSIHDSLFDRGLICFDDSGKIMISKRLPNEDKGILALDDEFGISMSEEMSKFMKWRRESILRNIKTVYHKEYGRGTIIDEDKNNITVLFDNGKKQMFMVETLERGILEKQF